MSREASLSTGKSMENFENGASIIALQWLQLNSSRITVTMGTNPGERVTLWRK